MAQDEQAKARAARKAELDKANAEAQRQMDEARPTPTQDEIDQAKLGAVGETDAPVTASATDDTDTKSRAASADTSGAAYKTRSGKSD